MSDTVARVEKTLGYEHVRIYGTDRLIRDLFAELKAARAETQQWRDVADRIGAETPEELYEGMTTFLYSIEIEGGYGTWGCSTLSEVFTAFGVKPGDTLKEVFELSERLRGESA